jgi:hypothetical protein
MANLLGQNIGTNYKGILNLNTLNGNLSGTLQAVTDGDGNASPLQLSTSIVGITNDLHITNTMRIRNALDSSQSIVFSGTLIYNESTRHDFNVGGITRLNLTATGLAIGNGTTSASARLQVRGDGTNPIARFEDNTGSPMLRIENSVMRFGASTPFGSLQFSMSGTAFSSNNNGLGLGFYSQMSLAATTDRFDFGFSGDAVANTAGTVTHLALVRNFAAGAGSANFRPLNLAYTINNSGAQTGTATGIFLNATETALNGMGHNLLDLQVGGVSQFRVDRIGGVTSNGTFVSLNSYTNFIGNRFQISTGAVANRTLLVAVGEGIMRISDSSEANFNRLQFGGTTNAFPAIKRNGAQIDFRLADDSGYCNITAGNVTMIPTTGTYLTLGNAGTSGFITGGAGVLRIKSNGSLDMINVFGNFVGIMETSVIPSAVFAIGSTTQGFLPPRMTTAQRDLIGTPAAGLMIYNTTTNRPNFYDGSAWVAL